MESNFWQMKEGSSINKALESLPKATTIRLFNEDGEEITKYRGTVVNGEVIDTPTAKYVLKQHEDAFRPIINGLSVAGVRDFKYMVWSDQRRAHMAVLVGNLDDGISFGFKAANTLDRSSTINYGLTMQNTSTVVQLVEKEHVLVWGLRQVCTNGMTIRVPLKSCKYLDSELVTKVRTLLHKRVSIVHRGNQVDNKIAEVQFIVEAYLLLKNPLNLMIGDAQHREVTLEQASAWVEKYIGKRKVDRILEQFEKEEQTLWGLYNAITHLASHGEKLSPIVRENLVNKGAVMLEEVLLA